MSLMPKILKLIKDLTWYNKVEKSKEILRLLTTIFLQDAPEDGNIYGRKDGSWRTFVYNDDLENNYIPLSGTIPLLPVTGGIEISFPDDFGGGYGKLIMSEYGDVIALKSLVNTKEVTPEGFYGKNISDKVVSVIFDQNDGGLSGSFDFSENANKLDFAQKIYVDNQRGKLISLTETEILAIASPEVGRLYYNTTQNHVVYYDGTNWKKISHSNM